MSLDAKNPSNKTGIAVIGGGAVGGWMASVLSDLGHAVTLCVRTPFERLELEQDGKTRTVELSIVGDPKAVRPMDWVLLAVKDQDTAAAEPWLKALLGPSSTLVVLQNGVGHRERVGPYSGNAPLVPALVYAAVERIRPGHILHHSGGRLILEQGEAGATFARLLEGSGMPVSLEADFNTAAWLKLLSNIAANPLTTLTQRRVGVMLEPKIHALARGLLLEGVAVARAEGAKLTNEDAEKVLAVYGTYGFSAGSSMFYDRLAGKSLEHEYLTGAVTQAGERHGVPTPLNHAILALLDALDKGRNEA